MLGTVISGDRRIGGAALEERVKKAASGLLSLGLEEGDRVAILLRNDIAFLEATFACGELGLYPVPINWHFSPDETAYVLSDSGAKAVVVHADLLVPLAEAVPESVQVIVVETPAGSAGSVPA